VTFDTPRFVGEVHNFFWKLFPDISSALEARKLI
jgi:hypothetical protein